MSQGTQMTREALGRQEGPKHKTWLEQNPIKNRKKGKNNSIIQFTEDATHLQPSITTQTFKSVPKRRQIIGIHLLLAYLYIALLTKPSLNVTKAIINVEL